MVFTSTSTNVDNKTEVRKIDVKQEENEVFYTSRNKNYRQQNCYTGSLNKNNQRCNFSGSKFHWEKNCPDAAEKSNNDL